MNELCRVVVVALLLVDVQRSVTISSLSSSSSNHHILDDDSRQEVSTATRRLPRCRPPSSDTLWMRLQYRSTGPTDQLPATSDDNADDFVGGESTERPATNNVDRRRHAVRHDSQRRRPSGRARRRRLKAAADSLASGVLDSLRRRGRTSKTRSEPSRRPTAWQCALEKFWRRTGPDVFPSYVQTGRCSTPTCMMGLYECRERRYAVGVLRRRRGRCVPLPLTGTNSTSAVEELWTPSHVAVVVACECSARRATGVFPRAASSPPWRRRQSLTAIFTGVCWYPSHSRSRLSRCSGRESTQGKTSLCALHPLKLSADIKFPISISQSINQRNFYSAPYKTALDNVNI